MTKIKVFKPTSADVPKNQQQTAVQEKKGLFNNFYEYIQTKGTFTAGTNYVQDGTTTLYTVPAGYTFYLFSGTFQFVALAAMSNDATYKIGGSDVLRMRTPNAANTHGEMFISFAIPLRLVASKTIQIFSGAANLLTVGTYQGILIKNDLIPAQESV